ncbi:hypothetical protein OKA05_13965 [Luteolibacter arcticus]|uniref:KH domain-containing protein n=1 Tax=Luteolibacter arcticus TaxID=1581411 RepID=A0ABT3GJG3_9BACT|nr:hypothetical protein [Luteolibacter arcticus]MCW1923667.1 hypothetical protein [Luteolibacter arcticus]
MPKRISETTDSLRQVGRTRVTDRGFLELLNTDLKELEIGSSLRRLGNTKVVEWDFKDTLPAVRKLAHQEVDVVGWMKRIAHYKVMEWDFRDALAKTDDYMPLPELTGEALGKGPGPEEMEDLVSRLKNFLQFVAANLIEEPGRAQIRVQEIAPGVMRFRLVVTQKDQKLLVGRDGETASAMRNMLKGTAAGEGVHVLLQILSHEEELTESLRESDAE